jgi:uncharacterized membrane protein YsdA (DUF1294 family)
VRERRGRSLAANAEMPGRLGSVSGRGGAHLGRMFLALGWVSLVAILAAWEVVPWIVGAVYVLASCFSFVAYVLDKFAAQAGRRRTRENTLHLLDLVGGWPGGLAAQQILRHKTRKGSFQVVFWLTVCANLAALAWLLLPLPLGS